MVSNRATRQSKVPCLYQCFIRFEYEYEIVTFQFTFSHFYFIYSSLPMSYPNMESEDSGNVTGLKFENRTRIQRRTRSPI